MIVELTIESKYIVSVDVDDEDEAIRLATEYYQASGEETFDEADYPEVERMDCENEGISGKVLNEDAEDDEWLKSV